VSNSGQKIFYAQAIAPSGSTILESIIGLTAPKISSLLQGPMIKENPKRKAPTKGKSQKSSKKVKVDDQADLEELDPSMEELLEEQVMEDEVDAAAADAYEEENTSAETTKEPSAEAAEIPPADDQGDAPQPKRTRHAVRKVSTISSPRLHNPLLLLYFNLISFSGCGVIRTKGENSIGPSTKNQKGNLTTARTSQGLFWPITTLTLPSSPTHDGPTSPLSPSPP
jgi:uncharacterized protein YceK